MQLADIELEKVVVGSLVLLPDERQLGLIRKIAPAFISHDFTRNIFNIMNKMAGDALEITAKSLAAHIKKLGAENECGGLEYVRMVIESGIVTQKIDEYIYRLKEYRLKRQLSQIAYDILNDLEDHQSPEAVIQKVDKSMKEVDVKEESYYTLKECVGDFIQHIKSPQKAQGVTFSWMPDNFAAQLPDGITNGVLAMIQAKSSHGKSTLAAQAAYEMAGKDKNVLYVTCEDGGHIFGMRTACNLTGKTHRELLNMKDSVDDLFKGIPLLQKADKFTIECNTSNWWEIERIILNAEMREHLDLVVIDYLQLLSTGNERSDARTLDLETIMRCAKTLAMRLQTVVIMVSQEKDDGVAKWASAAYDLADAVFRIKVKDYSEFKSGKAKILVDIILSKNKVGGGQCEGVVVWDRPIFKFEPDSPIAKRGF